MDLDRVENIGWVLPPEVFDAFYDELMESEKANPGEGLTKLFQRTSPFTRECE